MGEIAEYLIEQEMFGFDDASYRKRGFKKSKNRSKRNLTPAERKIASIRKEIAILVNEQGVKLEEARKMMNQKYGKGWRERGLVVNSDNQWSDEDLKPFL